MNTHYVQVLSDSGCWIDHLGLWECKDTTEAVTRMLRHQHHEYGFGNRPHRLVDMRVNAHGATELMWEWQDHRLVYEVLVMRGTTWPWTRLEGFDLAPLLRRAATFANHPGEVAR